MHTGANVAWEGLTKWGYVAYSEYWKKRIPAPVKCQKNCTCGPNKFVAKFDWNSYPYTRVSVQGVESLWVIADLFQQIGGHSSRFVLFCSF